MSEIDITSKAYALETFPQRQFAKEERELAAVVAIVEAAISEATSLPVEVMLPNTTATQFAAISALYTGAGWTVATTSAREADLKKYATVRFTQFAFTLS